MKRVYEILGIILEEMIFNPDAPAFTIEKRVRILHQGNIIDRFEFEWTEIFLKGRPEAQSANRTDLEELISTARRLEV